MTVQAILEKLKFLLGIPGVVGYERPLLEALKKFGEGLGDYDCELEEKLLVVKKKNTVSTKMMSVHIDRHGFVVNKEGKIEYAAFYVERETGLGVDAEEYVFEKVAGRFVGEEVYAYDMRTGEELSRGKIVGGRYDFEAKKVVFEVVGLKELSTGTPLALVSRLKKHNGYFSSQIDNAVSVALVMQILEEGFDGTVLFSTEEEIGESWKHIDTYLDEQHIITKELIVLDTTPYQFTHAVDKGLVVLRNCDERGEFNKQLVAQLQRFCEQEDIAFEFKDEVIADLNKELKEQGLEGKSYGFTELGRLVEKTNGEINGATIQIPSTRYHTNEELTSVKALENYYKLVKGILL